MVLYMFRACHAHHQEKQIVSIQLLVIVTPCWWQCRVLVWMHGQQNVKKVITSLGLHEILLSSLLVRTAQQIVSLTES